MVDADRVLDDLRALHAHTGGPDGARRVCWTPDWLAARSFLTERLNELGIAADIDEAGNLWGRLEGHGKRVVAIGSHLDSVPRGGRLDGALGVLAALEVLRSQAARPRRPCSLVLVDWADEEGARFGRSLYGSSVACGLIEADDLRGLTDEDGALLEDVLPDHAVQLDRLGAVRKRLEPITAAVELHIEQGPVLEARSEPAAAVGGVVGVQQAAVSYRGAARHAGTTPMDARHDPVLAAAEFALELERLAVDAGAVATVGQLSCRPGVKTVVPASVRLGIDMRHADAGRLEALAARARTSCGEVAGRRGCAVEWETLLTLAPIDFHPDLVAVARKAVEEAGGASDSLVSGALHDTAQLARQLPAVMVFAASRGGISHDPAEDSTDDDLRCAIRAFGSTVGGVMEWAAAQP